MPVLKRTGTCVSLFSGMGKGALVQQNRAGLKHMKPCEQALTTRIHVRTERHTMNISSTSSVLSLNVFMGVWRRVISTIVFLFAIALLSACASGPRLVAHAFSFDGWFDGWEKQADLLEYSYGDQYKMVRDKVAPDRTRLRPQAGVNGSMPVGDFLYVKWRVKETGEVLEDRVELNDKLPRDMSGHRLTFVIDGKQLYVYLVTPTPKNEYAEPLLKTTKSRYHVTYEIYPNNTYKR